MSQAIDLFNRAIEYDKMQNYNAAMKLYCDGLQIMVPKVIAETDIYRKQHLKDQTEAYLKRVELIRRMYRTTSQQQSNVCTALSASSVYAELCNIYKLFII